MRKILIFGAMSAIAQATARRFAKDGDQFFLVGRKEENLQAVVADLMVRGAPKVDFFTADLNDFDLHEKIISRAIASLGSLDIVLVAHGTLGDQSACQKDYLKAEHELRTNFLSIVSLLTPIANIMETQRRGCIAVISSVAGDRGRQSNYIYGCAKGAVTLFLQGLRNRLQKSSVDVLTIKPGFVDTPMTASLKKGLLFVGPDAVARGIYHGIILKKDVVYIPIFWKFIMLIVRCIPESLFKRMKL